jgi:hypothetical protein
VLPDVAEFKAKSGIAATVNNFTNRSDITKKIASGFSHCVY